MDSEIGIVESTEGALAYVAFATKAECEKCGACGGSGGSLLARNDAGASVGDRVRVESSNRAMLAVSAVMFLLPVAAIFSGIGLGELLGPAARIPSPLAAGVLAALGLAASLAFAVACDRKARRRSSTVVRIVGIFGPADGAEGGLGR